jgi:two-component system, cell cycle response regulator DivK
MTPGRRRSPESLAVVVIEDDLDARRIYSEYLRMKGWTVFTAPDGRAGLNKTMELTPDVVVLDLAMPKVDGWTVLKQLRESSMTAPILVVILSAMTEARDEAFYAGCDAFLTKPCPPEVVHLQLRALSRVRMGVQSV